MMSSQTRACASLLVLLGCAPAARQQAVTPRHALAALGTVQGRFNEAGDGAFVLVPASAADRSVLEQIAALDEATVPALIDCLADTSESRVTYGGVPTSLGAVCFWTLISTRFVQDHIQQGRDTNPALAGWVGYRAIEPEQQRHARRVWRAWFERRNLAK
jgi:hypothetical protein